MKMIQISILHYKTHQIIFQAQVQAQIQFHFNQSCRKKALKDRIKYNQKYRNFQSIRKTNLNQGISINYHYNHLINQNRIWINRINN